MIALMPHGSCFFWNIPLTTLHTTSDLLIAIAYFSIPLLLFLNRQYAAERARPLLLLFAAFILCCGVGHLIQVWNIWHANYWMEGGEKLVTALISGYTALQLRSHMPTLLNTQKALEETEELARLDPLTGLLNRRAFNEAIAQSLTQHTLNQTPFTLMLVDLDNFKAINDTYGHPVGDRLLKEMGELIRQNIRSIDWAARFGGDEFAILLAGCALEDALQVAQKLRQAVFSLDLRVHQDFPLNISISLGLADTNSIENSPIAAQNLYQHADIALYTAKRSGKNRICVQMGSEGGAIAPSTSTQPPSF
jgi:diguanylate cyclase (GGDEF)-like protein